MKKDNGVLRVKIFKNIGGVAIGYDSFLLNNSKKNGFNILKKIEKRFAISEEAKNKLKKIKEIDYGYDNSFDFMLNTDGKEIYINRYL